MAFQTDLQKELQPDRPTDAVQNTFMTGNGAGWNLDDVIPAE
jgi:hypothetical protein